jgi:hypothetical protein
VRELAVATDAEEAVDTQRPLGAQAVRLVRVQDTG